MEKLGAVVVSILIIIAGIMFSGFMLMCAVDVANDHWLTSLPNLGFSSACFIALFLRGVFTASSYTHSSDS